MFTKVMYWKILCVKQTRGLFENILLYTIEDDPLFPSSTPINLCFLEQFGPNSYFIIGNLPERAVPCSVNDRVYSVGELENSATGTDQIRLENIRNFF